MSSKIAPASSACQFGPVSHSKGGLRVIDSSLGQRDYVLEEHVRSSSIIASNRGDLNRDSDAMPPKHETASFFVCRQTSGTDTGHFELAHAVETSFSKFGHYVSSEATPQQCPPELTIVTQAAERAITAAESAVAALRQAEQLKESAAREITQAETLMSAAEKGPADAERLSQTMMLVSEKIRQATQTLCNIDALAKNIISQHVTAKEAASLAKKAAISGEGLFQPTLDAAIERHETAKRVVIRARKTYDSARNQARLKLARTRTIAAERQYEKAYEAAINARGRTPESIEKSTAHASKALAAARGEENAASGALLAAEGEFTAATEALTAAKALSAEFRPIEQRAAKALPKTRDARAGAKQILKGQGPLRRQVEIIQERVQQVAQKAAQREAAQRAKRQVAEEAAKQAIAAAARQAAEAVAPELAPQKSEVEKRLLARADQEMPQAKPQAPQPRSFPQEVVFKEPPGLKQATWDYVALIEPGAPWTRERAEACVKLASFPNPGDRSQYFLEWNAAYNDWHIAQKILGSNQAVPVPSAAVAPQREQASSPVASERTSRPPSGFGEWLWHFLSSFLSCFPSPKRD